MTTDVHHPFDVRNRDYLRPPTVHERTESLSRARSHSKLVSRLRIILPALAAGTFALYFFSPEIRVSLGDMDASVAGVVIDKGNLRMLNPKLEGVNEKQGAYVVTAKYAEQAVANPDVIYLTELTAETDSSAKGWSRLTAPKGIFETKTEKLNLTGDIRVSQSNGMTARLTSADLDTKAELITSDEPVKIDFSGGKLDASTMRINMDVKEVRFIGDVHVLLLRQPKDPAEQ